MTAITTATAEPEIILDLSRLLSRITHATPTGVDRCEMAYARGLLAMIPERLSFGAVHPIGFYGRLPRDAVVRFLDRTEERWATRGFASIWEMRSFTAGSLAALRPRPVVKPDPAHRRIYLQASPNNLTKPALVQHILRKEEARFVCLAHDLIPIEFPEYARIDGVASHEKRIRTLMQLASGIVANSQATLQSLDPWLACSGRTIASVVAHLGTHIVPLNRSPTFAGARPLFVCVGTIEPRKNHLLLLHAWRRMSEDRGATNIPKLIVIGRRGWENEQVVDLLERCPALKNCVEEHNGLPDSQTMALVASARALLLPSFAEGYGMPVTEALSAGVPVICSDLPALREAGGEVPDYLDPLDGPAWIAAIDDYAGTSSRRDRQLERLAHWRAPTWQSHLDMVLEMAREVVA